HVDSIEYKRRPPDGVGERFLAEILVYRLSPVGLSEAAPGKSISPRRIFFFGRCVEHDRRKLNRALHIRRFAPNQSQFSSKKSALDEKAEVDILGLLWVAVVKSGKNASDRNVQSRTG